MSTHQKVYMNAYYFYYCFCSLLYKKMCYLYFVFNPGGVRAVAEPVEDHGAMIFAAR